MHQTCTFGLEVVCCSADLIFHWTQINSERYRDPPERSTYCHCSAWDTRHLPFSARNKQTKEIHQYSRFKAGEACACVPAIIMWQPEEWKERQVNVPTSVTSRLDLDSAENDTENMKQFQGKDSKQWPSDSSTVLCDHFCSTISHNLCLIKNEPVVKCILWLHISW